LRLWQPAHVWRFKDEREPQPASVKSMTDPGAPGNLIALDQINNGSEAGRRQQAITPRRYTGVEVAKAWLPFAILSVFVLLWGLPFVKTAMGKATTPAFQNGGWEIPSLHKAVFRAPPVVTKPTPENAKFDFNWLTATGTGCFLAALLSAVTLGVKPKRIVQIFANTTHRMRFAIVAMSCMLGLGYVTRYSEMDAVLGLAFTRTGWLFPFFGTYIGWLGVALTGSDTSSNALFGGLQRITAQQLNLSPVLMSATNSAGGVMGKMVDAQSICIATAATNQVGNEGIIFRFVFWHSVSLSAIVGVIVMLSAYVFPQYIPHSLTFIH
jgi:lactate permease